MNDIANKPEVRFGEWMEKGFNIYKDNFGLLILAALIVFVLTVCTAGILAGPMAIGMITIILGLLDGRTPKPQVGDVFEGFKFFLHSFLFCLVWFVVMIAITSLLMLVPCVGPLLSIFVSFAIQALIMFGLFIIYEHKMDFYAASIASINKVKANFWPFLGFSIITGIIGGIGSMVCLVGAIFTMPIQICMVAVAYRACFPQGSSPSCCSTAPIQNNP